MLNKTANIKHIHQRQSQVNAFGSFGSLVNKRSNISLIIERLGFFFRTFEFCKTYVTKRMLQSNFIGYLTKEALRSRDNHP